MKRFLINGINAKTGGGKSILTNFIQNISTEKEVKYFILTPNKSQYIRHQSENIEIVEVANVYKKNLFFIGLFYIAIPKLIRKYQIDAVLNLSNIPIPTKIHQVFLFQWPYAVYPESTIWDKMNMKNKLIRKVKIFFFRINSKSIDTCIAQTFTIKERLQKHYNIKNIEVIPNSATFLNSPKPIDVLLPKGKKLLYLTHYYPHKNFEILIPFAERIKKQNREFKIITTIAKEQHAGAENFLNQIEEKDLSDIIVNIGPVEINQISSLYGQCDALVMPTILESYGLTFVEAMNYSTPIIASDLDFSHTVCKKAAIYFDPFNSDDLFDKTCELFASSSKISTLKKEGQEILKTIPNWTELVNKYKTLLQNKGR